MKFNSKCVNNMLLKQESVSRRQIQVVDTECFTVTETHGEERKDVEGKNEKRFRKREGTTQTTVAEHQGKISHAHN